MEQKQEQKKEMERLIKKLSMTCRSDLDLEKDKEKQKELQDKIKGKVSRAGTKCIHGTEVLVKSSVSLIILAVHGRLPLETVPHLLMEHLLWEKDKYRQDIN